MRAIFLMLKVEPGTLAEVADRITELESFSEAYSISGAYDLLVKLYVENFDDLSHPPRAGDVHHLDVPRFQVGAVREPPLRLGCLYAAPY